MLIFKLHAYSVLQVDGSKEQQSKCRPPREKSQDPVQRVIWLWKSGLEKRFLGLVECGNCNSQQKYLFHMRAIFSSRPMITLSVINIFLMDTACFQISSPTSLFIAQIFPPRHLGAVFPHNIVVSA